MTDLFETLIAELATALSVNLHVDRNHACAIQIHHKLTVQLQIDLSQENILIASFISTLPPGKFCENVLAEALKANHLPDPRTGIFSYLPSQNHLTLHQYYPISDLDGKKLAMYVAGFIDYAELWRETLERGETSPAPILGKHPFG